MSEQASSVLNLAQVGMPVYNRAGRQIGQVVRVHLTEENPIKQKTREPPSQNQEWLELIANVIEPDDPYALSLAKDLWEKGYIKISGEGLQGFQKYILPDQIDKIKDNGLYLKTSR